MTSKLSQPQAVTVALFLLGGAARPVDTEDIAVKIHELDPARFAWRKYPDRINLELVRVALSDGKRSENGGLTSGSGARGWTLTRAGLAWAQKAVDDGAFDAAEPNRDQRTKSRGESQVRRELSRILTSEAWGNWNNGQGQLTDRDAREVFRVDSYTDASMREQKVVRLVELFREDKEVLLFLNALADELSDGHE